ncbi:MAG: EAL domain-containing protein, partial [Janthinobacterium lividum]
MVGTGFAFLPFLQRFPINRIKVDQSFLREISERPGSAAIVEMICLLARKLGLSTTAEGIE